MADTKHTPPTASDCVRAAADLESVRSYLFEASGLPQTRRQSRNVMDAIAATRRAIDLLAAVAGSRVVGVGE